MGSPFESLRIVHQGYAASNTEAFALSACPNCGGTQVGVIAYQLTPNRRWMVCVNCGAGIVQNASMTSPGVKPLRVPSGVVGAELAVWEEVRDCLSVGASTAAVMLCRKLLLHLAVIDGLPEKDDRGWAPNFAQAVAHLQTVGLVTDRMRPWVDRIKDIGNDANHDLKPVTPAQALDVATFTVQLLTLRFEMPALMEAHGAQSKTEDTDVVPHLGG